MRASRHSSQMIASTLPASIGIRCGASSWRPCLRSLSSKSSPQVDMHESLLTNAAREIRGSMLAACYSSRKPNTIKTRLLIRKRAACVEAESQYQKLIRSLKGGGDKQSSAGVHEKSHNANTKLPEVGDWTEVRKQAETVAAWPPDVLSPQEKLSFASAFVSQVAEVLKIKEDVCGGRICHLYEKLCQSTSPIGVRRDVAVHSGVVVATDTDHLEAASREVASLILSGHAVSLAASRGQALEKAKEMFNGFPRELLQAVEIGPTITLPALVRTFRSVGEDADELWAEKVPPADYGNFGSCGSHGMAAAASSFTLSQINLDRLADRPHSRFELTSDIEGLTGFLSKQQRATSMPLNVYDRGVGKVQHLLELLHALHGPVVVDEDTTKVKVSLAAAHKHFVIMGSSTVPEDLVQAAIVAALSPFHEKLTLHAVGLGEKGLLRDPMLSFCRIIQSGKKGFIWRVKEHKDWSAFLDWLQHGVAEEVDPPQLFSTQRQFEIEVRRSCAEVGGVAWSGLFVPEPFEQLRRWTSVLEES